MDNEEYKSSEEKIQELMDSVTDKNSDDYRQVEKMLKRHDLVMVSIEAMKDVGIKQYPKWSADLIDKILSMEEIAKSCISFQRISNTPESEKLFFDYLMHPVMIRMDNLIKMEKKGPSSLNDEGRHLLFEQKKKLSREIMKGFIDLQNGLFSQKVANHVLDKSLKIYNRANPEETLAVPESIYRIPDGSWYRGLALETFWGIKGEFYPEHKERRERKFSKLLACLNKDQYLPKLLQRTDLTENEKNIYVYVAAIQSDLHLYREDADYFWEDFPAGYRDDRDLKIIKQIREKEIVYLVAKETDVDTAILFDEMLRGNHKKSVDFMTKLYTEVSSTIVKEYIRKQVDTSFDAVEKLAFYRESAVQRLAQAKNQDINQESRTSLKLTDPLSEKLHQFEKIYRAFNSPELKERYDYLESKDLLGDLRKCVFGDIGERKVELILLLKQETSDKKVKETIHLPEMMKKDIEELETLRISNGLTSINTKFANADYKKKLNPKELAVTMFELKRHFTNWDDRIQEQVKNYLTSHLKEDESEQTIKIFKEKVATHQIFAVNPTLEKKWKNILNSPDSLNEVSKVEKIKKKLDGSRVQYRSLIQKGVVNSPGKYDKGGITHSNITKKQVESVIEKVLDKKSIYRNKKSQKYRDACNIRKELIDGKYKIQHALNDAIIFVRKNGDPKVSLEKQFFEELYKTKVIQDFVRRDPKLKSVLYECQKLVPLTPSINNTKVKDSRIMNEHFVFDWWFKQWGVFDQLLRSSVNEKQQLTSNLNQKISKLWEIDRSLCTEVVWMLVADSAGAYMNLQSSYVGGFRGGGEDKQKNRGIVDGVMRDYQLLKWHIKNQKADLLPEKETTSPTTDFASLKKQALKEVPQAGGSGLNRETKESLVQMREFTEVKKSAIEKEKQQKESTLSVKDRIALFIRGRAN